MAVLFPDGSLGPRAAKRGAGREQHAQFLLGVFLFHHMFGRGEQFRELDQRGDALDALLPQEGSAFFFRKAQCALTGLVVHQQQEVDFLERARNPPSRSARLRSMRRMSARPQRSGAESPMAPNMGVSAAV
jgi:hypothetical protein